MKLLKRFLSFLQILVILLSLVGLAALGLVALVTICPPWAEFIVGLFCGWIAWDASDSSTDH